MLLHARPLPPLAVTGGRGDVCAEDYGGTGPFSEAEARNIRDFYLWLSPRPELAMAMHSFQQTVCKK